MPPLSAMTSAELPFACVNGFKPLCQRPLASMKRLLKSNFEEFTIQ
jgi:hypothetical protein